MYDRLEPALPASDARLLRRMAEEAGTTPEALLHQIVRGYLGLVRAAPEALPHDPLRRLAAGAIRAGG